MVIDPITALTVGPMAVQGIASLISSVIGAFHRDDPANPVLDPSTGVQTIMQGLNPLLQQAMPLLMMQQMMGKGGGFDPMAMLYYGSSMMGAQPNQMMQPIQQMMQQMLESQKALVASMTAMNADYLAFKQQMVEMKKQFEALKSPVAEELKESPK